MFGRYLKSRYGDDECVIVVFKGLKISGAQYGVEGTTGGTIAEAKVGEQLCEPRTDEGRPQDLPQERHLPQGHVSMTALVLLAHAEILKAPLISLGLSPSISNSRPDETSP